MTATLVNDPAALRAALARYRVMAIITGSFLLLVTIDVIIKYGGRAVFDWSNPTFETVSSVIAIVHGWIYVVYLVTAVDLWTRMKWSLRRLVYMVLGGIVPLLSFFAERRISAEVRASVET